MCKYHLPLVWQSLEKNIKITEQYDSNVNLNYFEVQNSKYFFRNLLSIGRASTTEKTRSKFLE
jgi:hypothetical protein